MVITFFFLFLLQTRNYEWQTRFLPVRYGSFCFITGTLSLSVVKIKSSYLNINSNVGFYESQHFFDIVFPLVLHFVPPVGLYRLIWYGFL